MNTTMTMWRTEILGVDVACTTHSGAFLASTVGSFRGTRLPVAVSAYGYIPVVGSTSDVAHPRHGAPPV